MTLSRLHMKACLSLVEARREPAMGQDWANWNGLAEALRNEIADQEHGALVFRLELPISIEMPRKAPRVVIPPQILALTKPKKPVVMRLCPTLNEYNGMEPWQKEKVRAEVDKRILALKASWPCWHWGGKVEQRQVKRKRGDKTIVEIHDVRLGGKRRLVRVTRFSSRRPDEVSADLLGGKIPLDRLVQAHVLGGDSLVWIDRKASWKPAPTEEGKVVVEVFELLGKLAVPGARSG